LVNRTTGRGKGKLHSEVVEKGKISRRLILNGVGRAKKEKDVSKERED